MPPIDTRPGWEGQGTYFECPLCTHVIKTLEPHETPPQIAFRFETREDEPLLAAALRFRMEQNMAANEALIWAHIETHHTLRDAVMALGAARTALLTIRAHTDNHDFLQVIFDGLGGQ
jgi:hypothetical protein